MKRRNRILVMLQAYFDDSLGGNFHGRPMVLVLGGFIATAEAWAAFSDEWQRILDFPPRISVFKMNDAMLGKGELRGVPKDVRDEKIKLLASTANDHAIA